MYQLMIYGTPIGQPIELNEAKRRIKKLWFVKGLQMEVVK